MICISVLKNAIKTCVGLLRDTNRSTDDISPFSNAYGIAQEAMLNDGLNDNIRSCAQILCVSRCMDK